MFEAGFPMYTTSVKTFPKTRQRLTWPKIWADIHFDVETLCLTGDGGKGTCS